MDSNPGPMHSYRSTRKWWFASTVRSGLVLCCVTLRGNLLDWEALEEPWRWTNHCCSDTQSSTMGAIPGAQVNKSVQVSGKTQSRAVAGSSSGGEATDVACNCRSALPLHLDDFAILSMLPHHAHHRLWWIPTSTLLDRLHKYQSSSWQSGPSHSTLADHHDYSHRKKKT